MTPWCTLKGDKAVKWRVITLALVAWLFSALQARAASATYFLAPGGSDSNAGKSLGAPWRTNKHAVICGDTIIAAEGIYTGTTNFNYGSWGTVDASGSSHGQCAAFLKCATLVRHLARDRACSWQLTGSGVATRGNRAVFGRIVGVRSGRLAHLEAPGRSTGAGD